MPFSIEFVSSGCQAVEISEIPLSTEVKCQLPIYETYDFARSAAMYLNAAVYCPKRMCMTHNYRLAVDNERCFQLKRGLQDDGFTPRVSKLICVEDSEVFTNSVIKYLQMQILFRFERAIADEVKQGVAAEVNPDEVVYHDLIQANLKNVKVVRITPAKLMMISISDEDDRSAVATVGLSLNESADILKNLNMQR